MPERSPVIRGTFLPGAGTNIGVRPLVRGRGVMAQATIGIRNIVALGYAEAVTRLERALQSIS